MKDPRPQPIQRRDYRPPAFWIDQVDLAFDLDASRTRVTATLAVRRNPNVAAEPNLRLDGERLTLVEVAIDGRVLGSAEYELLPDGLSVPAPTDAFTLVTTVEIDPSSNTELSGLYRSGTALCTQCEAEGFRRITYFLDRPDVMARYTTTIEADRTAYPVLLSNGNRVDCEPAAAPDRHRVCWKDPFPKPSYLFALVAADLRCESSTFRTKSGRDVRLEVWVEPVNVDACEHALRSLQRAMAWDEQTFGLEYDLDLYMIVAVNDFNMAAMENKGLNVFNAKYVLARPQTATDDDYEDIEAVIAHEYFHNWTGNRVTCRDWFQLTLKEGLTVFRDEQFTADMTSPAVKRIHDVITLRTAQFAEDQSPTAHPIRPDSYIEMNNFYTVTVYSKGAEVVRMMHTLLGVDGFRRGMDLYFERHDGQAVTCDDFRAALADANGADLEQFGLWYAQAGTPIVDVQTSFDSTAQTLTLEVQQRAPVNADAAKWQPMHIPIAVGLLGGDGRDLPPVLKSGAAHVRGTTALLELKGASATWTFGAAAPPVVSLLRGFTAPVKLRIDRTADELAFLMAHDADPFSRWDAAQTLAEATLSALVRDRAAGRELGLDPRFVAAWGRMLVDPGLDGSLRAAMIMLPDERVLAQHAEIVDVDGIHAARDMAMRTLALAHHDALVALYEAERSRGAYEVSRQQIASRRARNAALRYLVAAGKPVGVELALAQFDTADNMTDTQAALACLVDIEGDVREAPLAAFHRRWAHDPLVLDKWFAVQSGCSRADTLDLVAALMRHPDFNLRQPNRVRALIGGFSVRNQVRFHDVSGRGYRLLADAVIEIDASNPQLAARLVAALIQWRRLDGVRSAAMRAELARIAAVPTTSRDVGELVNKALGDTGP